MWLCVESDEIYDVVLVRFPNRVYASPITMCPVATCRSNAADQSLSGRDTHLDITINDWIPAGCKPILLR